MCNTVKSLIVPEYNFIVFRPSCVRVWVLSCFSCGQLFVTLWTVPARPLLSMGFSRQECRNGLLCPSPEIFPTQGSSLHLFCLLEWQAGSSHLASPRKIFRSPLLFQVVSLNKEHQIMQTVERKSKALY